MAHISREDESLKIAIEFITEIIEEAMRRFNIDFSTLNNVLDKLNYWEIFNDNELTCVGAHDGIEYVLSRIEESLNINSKT